MKDYATFLFGFTLCIAGCSSATENPSTGTSGVNTASAGTPAMAVTMTMTTTTQPSAAGMTATSMTATGTAGVAAGSAGSAAKPPTSTGTAGSASGSAGSSAAAAGSSAGATMAAAAPPGSWRAAYLAIFDASVSMCSQCHVSGGLLSPPDFSTPDKAYDSIVDKESSTNPQAQCHGMGKYVVPGNCEESLLYNKLSQDMPKCGRRMPPSSDAMPMRVAQDKLDLLCMWIKAGAKKD